MVPFPLLPFVIDIDFFENLTGHAGMQSTSRIPDANPRRFIGLADRRRGSLRWRMRYHVTWSGLILLSVSGGACAGDTYIDVDGSSSCDTTADCQKDGGWVFHTVCIDGSCQCPAGQKRCCRPGAEERGEEGCERQCRPVAECLGLACEASEDCPGPRDTRCGEATCERGVCGMSLRKEIKSQLAGDCKVTTCDERGETSAKEDPFDFFNDGNECTLDTCDEDMTPVNLPIEKESTESSGYCTSEGRRVACRHDDDCRDPSFVCSKAGSCVPIWCDNGVFNSSLGETAMDCGGECDPCRSGLSCRDGRDCIEHICGDDGKCAFASCSDGVQNGSETDKDCGAPSCGGCDDGQPCNSHKACKSGVCFAGKCEPSSCDDGVENGAETGIDCGAACPGSDCNFIRESPWN
jgi:hypothetical protein